MWSKLKEQYNKLKLGDKKLYLVTNSDKFSSDDEFLDTVASALEGGVDMVQLKEKNMPAKHVIELGRKIKQLCLEYNATFIVNDRADIAAIVGADGVHVGQDGMDVKSVREIMGENAIVGVSTHSPKEALKAIEDGADYIFVGPIFANPTKKETTPVEIEYAKWVSENIKIPAFGIGGIDTKNCTKVFEAGIKRIAVIEAIMNAKNPNEAAKIFLTKI